MDWDYWLKLLFCFTAIICIWNLRGPRMSLTVVMPEKDKPYVTYDVSEGMHLIRVMSPRHELMELHIFHAQTIWEVRNHTRALECYKRLCFDYGVEPNEQAPIQS